MSKVSIKDNLAYVRQHLSKVATEAGRSPEEIQLIAVSKKKPAAMINEAFLAIILYLVKIWLRRLSIKCLH